jgi:hypothetical protein
LTIVVILILIVVWAAVLGPGFLKRAFERRSADSIGDFHRQLRVLERAGPSLVRPAFRLATAHPDSSPRRRASDATLPRPGLALVGPDRQAPRRPVGAGVGAPTGGPAGRDRDPYFRPGACKRRRDVLLCLLSAVFATSVLGAIPALRPLLLVTVVAVVLCALYLALLVRSRQRALERSVKLRYLPPPVASSSVVVRRAAAR